MGKNATKQEWRESAAGLLTQISYDIVQRVSTKEIRIEIVNSPLNQERRFTGCIVQTYRKEQNYEFFSEENEEKTVISVYQKEMNKNAGKYISLVEHKPFNELDYETQCLYRDAIVNFLMANIVWK